MLDSEEAEGVKHMKTLKQKSFELVMSDGEEAEEVKHVKTLKQDSFEPVMLDDDEVEQVVEGNFCSTERRLMEMCQSFEELVHHLRNTEFSEIIPEFHTVMCLSDIVDKISQTLYPHDAPRNNLSPQCVNTHASIYSKYDIPKWFHIKVLH